jgi:hypothetical protein
MRFCQKRDFRGMAGLEIEIGPNAGEGLQMNEKLNELLDKAKKVKLSPEQKEEQRRSFAYGNTKIENSRITRETVDCEAEELKKSN